jgi:hypothetical protein
MQIKIYGVAVLNPKTTNPGATYRFEPWPGPDRRETVETIGSITIGQQKLPEDTVQVPDGSTWIEKSGEKVLVAPINSKPTEMSADDVNSMAMANRHGFWFASPFRLNLHEVAKEIAATFGPEIDKAIAITETTTSSNSPPLIVFSAPVYCQVPIDKIKTLFGSDIKTEQLPAVGDEKARTVIEGVYRGTTLRVEFEFNS